MARALRYGVLLFLLGPCCCCRCSRCCSCCSCLDCIHCTLIDLSIFVVEITGATTKWSPRSFVATVVDEIPHFGGNQQQDAHEFLRFLLDRLDAEYHAAYESMESNRTTTPPFELPQEKGQGSARGLKKMQKRQSSKHIPAKDLNNTTARNNRTHLEDKLPLDASSATLPFEGRAMSRVRCGRCSRCTETEQPFLDISVDVPERTLYVHRNSSASLSTAEPTYQCRPLSLDDCLRRFTHVEKLRWSEKYQCSHCLKDRQKASSSSSSSSSSSVSSSSFPAVDDTFIIRSYAEIAAGMSPFVGLEPTTKQIEIITPPNILVVHFKRLKMFPRVKKIKRHVQFPLVNLNVTPYIMDGSSNNSESNKRKTSGEGSSEINSKKSTGRTRTRSGSTSPKRRNSKSSSSSSSSSNSSKKRSNLSVFNEQQCWYHLSSVVIHHGNGNNGHYTCCVKNTKSNTWTHRNDSRVTVVSAEYVASQEAYMLIYERGEYLEHEGGEKC